VRADAAFPNPVFEWRRENLNSSLQPDIFGTLQVPLDVTGRRFALRSAVAEGTARGRADSAAAVRTFEADVARAYWRAALAAELLSVAAEEQRARVGVATFDSGRFREGAVAEVVAMRTRLEADRARIAQASARLEAERARGDLARALGVPLDSLPPLAEIAPVQDVDAAPTLSSALAAANAARPDLVSLRHAAAEAERRATAERRGVVSDLQLVSGYKTTSGINTGVIAVMVPLPMFNRNEGAKVRSRGEAIVAQAELRDAEARVRADVTAAVRGYEAIREALADGVAGIEARATEIAAIAEGAYREGAISLMELVEAQRTRAESRAAALRWTVDVQLARIELNRATGAPIMTPIAASTQESR
jgi:cobalt-zinc-cadmium efflux system outer membrane protein